MAGPVPSDSWFTVAASGTSMPATAAAIWLTTLAIGLLASGRTTAQTCTTWKSGGTTVGHIEDQTVTESSGLAASRRRDGAFWTHNDSGGGPRLFLMEDDGTAIATVRLIAAPAVDWEDIATAPCGSSTNEDSQTCLYVADIGDNEAERETVRIFRFPEPTIPDDTSSTVPVDDWKYIDFTYADGARNAETVLVHPHTAEIYVVEKSNSARPSIYPVPNRPTSDGTHHTVEATSSLEVGEGIGRQVTAGDFAPDGRSFSIRTYVKILSFCAGPDKPYRTAFDAEPIVTHPQLTLQSEALAYARSGDALFFTTEGARAPVVRLESDSSGRGDGGANGDGDAGAAPRPCSGRPGRTRTR